MRSLIARLIHAIRRQADAPIDDTPKLNRKQRRELARQRPGEQRMRMQRTFIAQAKRRSSKRGDHGAKSRRAFTAGVRKGTEWTHVQIKQAYAVGLKEGRAQGSLLRRFATKARALASARPIFGKTAAQ